MAEKYIVCSGKGGSGKSSVTAGLAISLAAKGKKVLCVDLDTLVKSLDLLLGAGESVMFNWYDALSGACTPENAVLKTAYNLLSLSAPPVGNNLNSDFDSFSRLIGLYDNMFDIIVFDLPSGKSIFSDYAIRLADCAVIVTNPDNISLRSSALVSEKLRNTLTNIRLIVNKADKDEIISGAQKNLDDCVDLSSARLLGVVPFDNSVVQLQSGAKLSAFVSSSFSRIADRILGKNVPFSAKNL